MPVGVASLQIIEAGTVHPSMGSFTFVAEQESCDTVGWSNGFGYGCADYEKHWCANGVAKVGQAWALGAFYNYPEENCCTCGKNVFSWSASKHGHLLAKQDLGPDGQNEDALFSNDAKNSLLQNSNNASANSYMNMGNVDWDQYRQSDGKFHFQILWAGHDLNDLVTVMWKQTNPPNESVIEGFEFQTSSSSWVDTEGYCTGFRGLGTSDYSGCVLDGNAGLGCWYNCIGATTSSKWLGKSGVPGPNGKGVFQSALFVQLPLVPVPGTCFYHKLTQLVTNFVANFIIK